MKTLCEKLDTVLDALNNMTTADIRALDDEALIKLINAMDLHFMLGMNEAKKRGIGVPNWRWT